MNILLLMLAAGCEMMFGTEEGSSGRAEIIKTSGSGTCIIRLESKTYREPYRVASDATLSRCRQNIGKQVTVRFDSSWQITHIEPVT
ncbi:hypothetical protein ABZ543_31285 [Streptomyces roseifaciens]